MIHDFFAAALRQDPAFPPPMPYARPALRKLAPYFRFAVITSRAHAFLPLTRAWLARHFGDVLALDGDGDRDNNPSGLLTLTNEHALISDPDPNRSQSAAAERPVPATSKRDAYERLGVNIVVDDNPVYIREAQRARGVLLAVLFDLDGRCAWSRMRADEHVVRLRDARQLHALAAGVRERWQRLRRRQNEKQGDEGEEGNSNHDPAPVVRITNWGALEELLASINDGGMPFLDGRATWVP